MAYVPSSLSIQTSQSSSPSRFSKIRECLNEAGVVYLLLRSIRSMFEAVMGCLDNRLVRIEQRRRIVQPWTISTKRHSVSENTKWWDDYDWTRLGEEWTKSPQWKDAVVAEFLEPYVATGAEVLEIGPGGGRWTEVLLRRATSVVAIDISTTVLDLCRARFAGAQNVRFVLGSGSSLDLPDSSVDAVWSYDVFVHINPADTRGYLLEIGRVLRPGGRAVIHHPSNLTGVVNRRAGWRSDVTDDLFDMFAREAGLKFLKRSTAHVNPGDSLTVLERPRG